MSQKRAATQSGLDPAAGGNHAEAHSSKRPPGHTVTPGKWDLLQLSSVQAVLQVSSHSEERVLRVAHRLLHGYDLDEDEAGGTGDAFPPKDSSSKLHPSTKAGKRPQEGMDTMEEVAPKRQERGLPQDGTITAAALLEALEEAYGLGPADTFVGHRSDGLEAARYSRPVAAAAVGSTWTMSSLSGAGISKPIPRLPEDQRQHPNHTEESTVQRRSRDNETHKIVGEASLTAKRSVGEASSATLTKSEVQSIEAKCNPSRVNMLTSSADASAVLVKGDFQETHAPRAMGHGQAEPSSEVESLRVKERIQELKSENSKLKARQQCKQCKERPAGLTLLPCGHFCFCVQCGRAFSQCPVCHKTILADVVTFVA